MLPFLWCCLIYIYIFFLFLRMWMNSRVLPLKWKLLSGLSCGAVYLTLYKMVFNVWVCGWNSKMRDHPNQNCWEVLVVLFISLVHKGFNYLVFNHVSSSRKYANNLQILLPTDLPNSGWLAEHFVDNTCSSGSYENQTDRYADMFGILGVCKTQDRGHGKTQQRVMQVYVSAAVFALAKQE